MNHILNHINRIVPFFQQSNYFIKMKNTMPQPIMDWLKTIQLQKMISANTIQNGQLVNSIMSMVLDDYHLQLLTSNTTVTRTANWDQLTHQLNKHSIKLTNDERIKLSNGQHETVFKIISKLRQIYIRNQKSTQVDINKLDNRSEIGKSKSLLELMLIALMRNLYLNSKESVALLSNESKYLAHVLAKGLKNQFKPVENFINQLRKNLSLIQHFCKNQENQTFFIKSIKPGIISKSVDVAENCLNLIKSLTQAHTHQANILEQHLLGTMLLAIRRHHSLSFSIAEYILHTSNYDTKLLIKLKQHCNQSDYQNVVIEIWKFACFEEKTQQIFQMNSFINLIQETMLSLNNPETAISSLSFLLLLCQNDSTIVIDQKRGEAMISNLTNLYITKKEDILVIINLLYGMLSSLGKYKNPCAPSLYKLLTQKYKDCLNCDESEVHVLNFIDVLKTFPLIPCSAVIDAIEKRINQSNLAVNALQMQLLEEILSSENVDLKTCLIIYNICSKILIEDISLGAWAGSFICKITKRFLKEHIISETTLKLLKVCLAVNFANVKKIMLKKKPSSSSPQPAIAKLFISNQIIQQFVKNILQFSNGTINQSISQSIVQTYHQIHFLSKQQSEPIYKIVQILGKPQELITKYPFNHQNQQTPGLNRYKNEQGNSHQQIPGRNKLSSKRAQSSTYELSSLVRSNISKDASKGLQKYHKVYLEKIQKKDQEKAKLIENQQKTQKLKKIIERKIIQFGINIKPKQNINLLYDFGIKQRQIEENKVKDYSEIVMFNTEYEEDRDIKSLQSIIKKYNKTLKLAFSQHQGKKNGIIKSFDQRADKNQLIQIAGIWKLLKENALDQYITLDQTKFIVRKINYIFKKQSTQALSLDFQAFQQFFIQISFIMFSRNPKDLRGHPISQMVEQTFRHFKVHSVDNKLNQKNFQEPQNIYYNQTQAIVQMNKKLQQNPSYIVPEGYKKITQKKIIFSYQIYVHSMSQTYKNVIEVLDQILNNQFGFHIIQPFTTTQTISRVRPSLYYIQRKDYYANDINLSFFMKKQIEKFPINDRDIARQVASLLQNIIQAVDHGYQQIGLKFENKSIRQKKKKEQQKKKRQQEEKKKWEHRDKQLKQKLQRQKQKMQQKRSQLLAKKKQDEKKEQIERKKRQKEEQEKKRKIQEYSKIKQQQRIKQENMKKQKKIKEKQDMERKKRQLQQVKKKIQEARIKKEEQQNLKKIKQAQEQKRIKEDQKKRHAQKQQLAKLKLQEYRLKKQSNNTKELEKDKL